MISFMCEQLVGEQILKHTVRQIGVSVLYNRTNYQLSNYSNLWVINFNLSGCGP